MRFKVLKYIRQTAIVVPILTGTGFYVNKKVLLNTISGYIRSADCRVSSFSSAKICEKINHIAFLYRKLFGAPFLNC